MLKFPCDVSNEKGTILLPDLSGDKSDAAAALVVAWEPRGIGGSSQITFDICRDIEDVFSSSKQPKLKVKLRDTSHVFVFSDIASRDTLLNLIVTGRQQFTRQEGAVTKKKKSVNFKQEGNEKSEPPALHIKKESLPKDEENTKQKDERRTKRKQEVDTMLRRQIDKGWHMYSVELKSMYALLVDSSADVNTLEERSRTSVKRERVDADAGSSDDEDDVAQYANSILLSDDEFAALYAKEKADYYSYHTSNVMSKKEARSPLALQPTAVPSVYAIVDSLASNRIVDPVTHRLNTVTPAAAAAVFRQHPFLEKVYRTKFFSKNASVQPTAEDELLFWEGLVLRTLFFMESAATDGSGGKEAADELLQRNGADMSAPPMTKSPQDTDAGGLSLLAKLNKGSARILADYTAGAGATDYKTDLIDSIKVDRELQHKRRQRQFECVEDISEDEEGADVVETKPAVLPVPAAVEVLQNIMGRREYLSSQAKWIPHQESPYLGVIPSPPADKVEPPKLSRSCRKELKRLSQVANKELRTFNGLLRAFWTQRGQSAANTTRLTQLRDATQNVSQRISSAVRQLHSLAHGSQEAESFDRRMLWTERCVVAMSDAVGAMDETMER